MRPPYRTALAGLAMCLLRSCGARSAPSPTDIDRSTEQTLAETEDPERELVAKPAVQ
jgi:hypothetical protein